VVYVRAFAQPAGEPCYKRIAKVFEFLDLAYLVFELVDLAGIAR
jgi:hypothetical protein